MPLLAKNKGGQDFDPVPADMHHGVCYGVVDLGTQPAGQFKPSRKVVIIWELPELRIDVERDGKKLNLPRAISKRYTLSLSEKSNLRPELESWRGRAFTNEELDGFDLAKLIGANCLLNVKHVPKKSGPGVFADIASVSPLMKTMTKRQAENPPLYFSIDDQPTGPLKFPENMPDWMREAIAMSAEYHQRTNPSKPPREMDEHEQHAPPSETADEALPF